MADLAWHEIFLLAVPRRVTLLVATVVLPRVRRNTTVPAVAAAGMAALVWSGQLVGVAVADAVRWPVSLWLGVVVLAAFATGAVGLSGSTSD